MDGEPPPHLMISQQLQQQDYSRSSSNEMQQVLTEGISPPLVQVLASTVNQKDFDAPQNGNEQGDSDKRHSSDNSEDKEDPSTHTLQKPLGSKETILLDEGVGVAEEKPTKAHSSPIPSSATTNLEELDHTRGICNDSSYLKDNDTFTKLGIPMMGESVVDACAQVQQPTNFASQSQRHERRLQNNRTIMVATTTVTNTRPQHAMTSHPVMMMMTSSSKTAGSPPYVAMNSSDTLNHHSNDEDSEDSDSSFRMVIDEENAEEEEELDEELHHVPNTTTTTVISTTTSSSTSSVSESGRSAGAGAATMLSTHPMSYPALATSNLQILNKASVPQRYSNNATIIEEQQPQRYGSTGMTTMSKNNHAPLPSNSNIMSSLASSYPQKLNLPSTNSSTSFILDTLIESSSHSNTLLSMSNNNTATNQWFHPQRPRTSSQSAIENDLTMPGQLSYSIMSTPTGGCSQSNASCPLYLLNHASSSLHSQPSQNIMWNSPSYKFSGFLDENVLSTTRLIQQQQQQQLQQQQHATHEALTHLHHDSQQTNSLDSTTAKDQPPTTSLTAATTTTESSTTSNSSNSGGHSCSQGGIIVTSTNNNNHSNQIITDSYSLDGASSNFQIGNITNQEPQKPSLLPQVGANPQAVQPLISHISINTNAVYQQAMHYNSLLASGNTTNPLQQQQQQQMVPSTQQPYYSSIVNTSIPSGVPSTQLGFINCFTPTSSCPSAGTPAVWPQPLQQLPITPQQQQQVFNSVQNVKNSTTTNITNVYPPMTSNTNTTSSAYSTTSSTASSSSSSVSSMNIDEVVKGKRKTRRITKQQHSSPMGPVGIKKNQVMTFQQRELKQERDNRTREHILTTHYMKENNAQPFSSSYKFVNQYEEMNNQQQPMKALRGTKNSNRPNPDFQASSQQTPMPNWIQKTSSLRGKSKKALKEQQDLVGSSSSRTTTQRTPPTVNSETPAVDTSSSLKTQPLKDDAETHSSPPIRSDVEKSKTLAESLSPSSSPQPIKQKLKMKYKTLQ